VLFAVLLQSVLSSTF